MFRTLRSRIIATYLLVVVISLLLASLVFFFFLGRYARNRERDELLRQITAIAKDIGRIDVSLERLQVQPQTSTPTPAPGPLRKQLQTADGAKLIQLTLQSEADVMQAKVGLISQDGTVVAESTGRPVLARRIGNVLPEVLKTTGPTVGERDFEAIGRDYLYAVAPTTLKGGTQGYAIAIKVAEETGGVMASLVWYVVVAGLIALGISMLVALYLSGAISRPVKAVAGAARRMAAGDYNQEVEAKGPVETQELANDFNVMAERVRSAYEQQRNFVGNVSHELRTPLTSIEGFSQSLLDGVSKSEEERNRALTIINQESKRLVRLLRDLLLLSQVDAGELKGEKKAIDTVEMLQRLSDLYMVRAEEEGLEFRVEWPPHVPSLFTDQDRLERVLTNLLDNAFKYSGSGGAVLMSAAPAADWLQISVSDNGPGIEAASLSRIFDRFYRVEKSRSQKHGGAGLGLAICKELVESLGGRIMVTSTPGRGTTFTLTLPL